MKLDILAFGAHPDDVELACGGTLIKHVDMGFKCGVIDLTRGELGTRGDAVTRVKEAADSAKIMGLSVRENLEMKDVFFTHDEKHMLKVIEILRKYQPDYVLANAVDDRHPDHAKGATLVRDACFLSGLIKIKTKHKGKDLKAWRPRKVLHYIQDNDLQPQLLVDISGYFEKKWQAISAFKSQFYNPKSKEPVTYISTPEFLETLKGRQMNWGKYIGVKFAEGYTTPQYIGVRSLNEVL